MNTSADYSSTSCIEKWQGTPEAKYLNIQVGHAEIADDDQEAYFPLSSMPLFTPPSRGQMPPPALVNLPQIGL